MIEERLFVLLGFLIGLVPTFGLLWAVMSRYEHKIAERDTNTSFIIGIFGGIVVIVGHLFFIVAYSFTPVGIASAFGLAAAECLLYFIYLNRKKLKKRSDKAFLGLGFGLGVASMYIAFLMGQMFVNVDYDWSDILGMLVFASGVSTIRGSMGILMSRGKEKKDMARNTLIGTGILGTFNLLVVIYLNPIDPFFWVFTIPGAIIGIVTFHFFFKDLAAVRKERSLLTR